MVVLREGVRLDAAAKKREAPSGAGGSCNEPVTPGSGRGEAGRCEDCDGRLPPSDLAGQLGIMDGWIACGRSVK